MLDATIKDIPASKFFFLHALSVAVVGILELMRLSGIVVLLFGIAVLLFGRVVLPPLIGIVVLLSLLFGRVEPLQHLDFFEHIFVLTQIILSRKET